MKYALISDIHGNMPALKAVLDDAKKNGVNKFVFVGDYCGGLSYPNEVIDAIRHIDNAYVVCGNHEDYLDNLSKQDQRTWTDGQFSALYWCYKTLSIENREYLSKLPREIEINHIGTPLHVFHSAETYFSNSTLSKFSSSNYALCYRNKQITYEKYKQDLIEQLHQDDFLYKNLTGLPDEIYIFGHSHVQWHTNLCNKILINPGSCGIPLDGNISASFTIVENINDGWLIEERRVSYDLDSTINELIISELYNQANVMSNILINQLRTGREYISFFLEFVCNYANKTNNTIRPYSHEVWNKAYEIWHAK